MSKRKTYKTGKKQGLKRRRIIIIYMIGLVLGLTYFLFLSYSSYFKSFISNSPIVHSIFFTGFLLGAVAPFVDLTLYKKANEEDIISIIERKNQSDEMNKKIKREARL